MFRQDLGDPTIQACRLTDVTAMADQFGTTPELADGHGRQIQDRVVAPGRREKASIRGRRAVLCALR
ncbi:hypothetical protein P3W85_36900 [Cupriavidus basilensis]|uniref:Uncharacterized protein n=1 Tax=Cupriavidus basilensis TaxID=68895 RepID=A0ABT6B0R5_9BURK|nr:hypothetical protein [Cupriavidus basilensis]MDF3838472.1 hypothetical protein [Cupriavidus basilensis]